MSINYNNFSNIFNFLITNIIVFMLIYFFIFWFDTIYVNQTVPDGVYGMIGKDGPVGNKGINGVKGIVNPDKYIINKIIYNKIGPSGNKGDIGSIGYTGPDGMRGKMGQKGPDGLAGSMGPIGDIGDIGSIGETGNSPDWYFENISQDCTDGIYDDIGNSQCPEKTIMTGMENIIGTENLKIKCCKLTVNSEIQQEKYKLIKKGVRVNDVDPRIY